MSLLLCGAWAKFSESWPGAVLSGPGDGRSLGLIAAAVLQVFQKCGMVKEDDEGRKRVKIYRDKEGRQKGDGLVTYLKEPSVSHVTYTRCPAVAEHLECRVLMRQVICLWRLALLVWQQDSTCLQQPTCPNVACPHGQLFETLCFASSSSPGQAGKPECSSFPKAL